MRCQCQWSHPQLCGLQPSRWWRCVAMTVRACSARQLARQRARVNGAIVRRARPAAKALEGTRDLAMAPVATPARVAIVTLHAQMPMPPRSRAWVMQRFVPKETPWKAPRWH